MKRLLNAEGAFAWAAGGATMLSLKPNPDTLYRHDNNEVGRSDSYTGMRKPWERPNYTPSFASVRVVSLLPAICIADSPTVVLALGRDMENG